jgi:peptide/nickel transport system substrate-binding protein
MRISKRPWPRGLVVAALGVCFAVVGCGGGGSKTTPSSGTHVGATTGATGGGHQGLTATAPPAETPTIDGASAPKSITIAVTEPITPLNPGLTLTTSDLRVLELTGGKLLVPGPDASTLHPQLASGYKVSTDGRQYTFTLRPNLHFSDNSPLTSKDVAATLNFERADKTNAFTSLLAGVRSISTPSADTVVFKLKGRSVGFPATLALSQFAIYPAAAAAKGVKYFDHVPVTSGPYKFEAYSPNKVTLVRNSNYPGPRPAVETLTVVKVADQNTAVAQLQSGQVQFVDNLPPTAVSQLTGRVHASLSPTFAASLLFVNDRSGPLANVNVRKAIDLAIDRQQINKLVWGGFTTPLRGFLPGGIKGVAAANLPAAPNLGRAKQLLAGTPCASGCSLKIMVSSANPLYVKTATLLQAQLAKIGVKGIVQQVDPSISAKAEGSGSFELEVNAFVSASNVPDQYLNTGLLSTGGVNALFSGYKSPTMDDLITRFHSATQTERTLLLGQIHATYAADVPWIPLVNLVDIAGTTLPPGVITVGNNTRLNIATAGTP